MKIAVISSKKLGNVSEGVLKNDYLYNDKELFDDGDLNWYDYGFRNYDAQIGKFVQMDPLADGNSDFSPYAYAANDPIGNIDFMGLDPVTSTLSTTAATAITLSTVTITAVKATSSALSTVSLVSKFISITGITLQLANTASNIINSSITTSGVGGVDPGRRFAIEARGYNEGFRSALTLGMSEWFSGDPLGDYSTPQEKLWYLQGRLKGDAAAVVFGLAEADVGAGGMLTTGATGVGALVSGGAIAHGLSMSAKATADIALTWQKIYKLNMAGSSGASSTPAANNGSGQSTGGSGKKIVQEITAPKGWLTKASNKGGGVKFVDPKNPHNSIRQMPGNPRSPNPAQQNPYVIFKKNGVAYDVNGMPLKNATDPASHIPLNKFNINKMPKFD